MAFIRVTSGTFRGRKMVTPKGLTTRPTSAKAREAVASILNHLWQDSDFLDLFSGSGIMGIEALSHGCRTATFIDHDKHSIEAIRSNLITVGRSKETVLPYGVKKAFHKISGRRFHIIWADPPYSQIPQWLEWFRRHIPMILANNGVFALESHLKDQEIIQESLVQTNQLRLDKSKRYGQSLISFFSKTCE